MIFTLTSPVAIALLVFCVLLVLYLLVRLIVALIRWTARIIKFLIYGVAKSIRFVIYGIFRTTKRVITKGLVFGRAGLRYVVRVGNRVVEACNQSVAYVDQRVRRRGTPTYPISSPYGSVRTQDLNHSYYSSSGSYSAPHNYPTTMTASTLIVDSTGFTASCDIGTTKSAEVVRFCQICGSPLDVNPSLSEFPFICRECGSDLSLGIDPICRKPVILGEDAVSCPHCLTVFHRHHVADWASSHGQCPFCNAVLLPKAA